MAAATGGAPAPAPGPTPGGAPAGGGATGAAGGTPAAAPLTPGKALILTALAAAGLGYLTLSVQKGTGAYPYQNNTVQASERAYNQHTNMYTDTFKTSGGEIRIQTPGGEIADLIAKEFGLAEADYGSMNQAQRQKAYLLIDQDNSGIINLYEAQHVARNVIRRIARDGLRDY